jgi:hypothetical protein
MELKMDDVEFLGDITALLRPSENYDPQRAYEIILTRLLNKR